MLVHSPIEGMTTWHITWGTYGARLHGGERPTVDRTHNQLGEAFITENIDREIGEQNRMRADAVLLPLAQRQFIEHSMQAVCARGGWELRCVAAAPDHVHVLCDAPARVHGKQVRRWMKTWLTKLLTEQFATPASGNWWAECGSTKAVKDASYLRNASQYIEQQRATRDPETSTAS